MQSNSRKHQGIAARASEAGLRRYGATVSGISGETSNLFIDPPGRIREQPMLTMSAIPQSPECKGELVSSFFFSGFGENRMAYSVCLDVKSVLSEMGQFSPVQQFTIAFERIDRVSSNSVDQAGSFGLRD